MSNVVAAGRLLRQAFERHAPDGRAVTADTNFFEAGFTSVALAAVLADAAGIYPPLALVDLFRFPTLRALTAELDRRAGTRPQWTAEP